MFVTFNCFRQTIALLLTEIECVCKHLLLRLKEDSSLSHLSLEKKKSCFTIPEKICHTVLRFPRNQKCEKISKWSQTCIMKFFQIQTISIPVVQMDFSWVCHNYWQLLKSLPLMLKVRGPPQWPSLIISNGMEVDFQTVGSLTQQGSGSPGQLTPTCRETQPYALAHYSATGNQLWRFSTAW